MSSNDDRLGTAEDKIKKGNYESVNERIDYIQITIPECRKLQFWCGQLTTKKEKCCITHLSENQEIIMVP